ncbi:triple QxxK/R motif-containing protein isoform X5 [Micropterus dolomieu]|uniref:triple QxxK/R motif-containing protein isoform X5 n=1 Tax=Micropterus dolomieu TaxID=147949 RepID=UPI001E8CBFF4|nr:triple QxxK/R motif-containing protein isoform X5 [Micropterus dolomieu]
MGKKDASATRLPVDQYRKQIGKQDYKKTKSVLKATRLKAEAKKNSSGFRSAGLILRSSPPRTSPMVSSLFTLASSAPVFPGPLVPVSSVPQACFSGIHLSLTPMSVEVRGQVEL